MIDYDNPNFSALEAEYETMYSLVGYFIAQYSLVELGISFVLSLVCKMEDPQAFHALTKGMDLKTKIQRVKKLCVRPRQKIGKKFDKCLTFLHDDVANLRNYIAHSALLKSKDDPQRIYFSAVGSFPLKAFGFKGKSDNPKVITFDALESYGDWLHALQTDIIIMLEASKGHATVFEIKHLRSKEPEAFLEHIRLQDENAKAHSFDGKFLG